MRNSPARGWRDQLELEQTRRAQLWQAWHNEKEHRLALEYYIEACEERLAIVLRALEQQREEVSQLWAAVEEKEQKLDGWREQWDRRIAQREHGLADREKRLENREERMDAARHQLNERLASLPEQDRRATRAENTVRERGGRPEIERTGKTDPAGISVDEQQGPGTETPKNTFAREEFSQEENSISGEANRQQGPRSTRHDPRSVGCFEEGFDGERVADETMEDAAGESGEVVDRLVSFHFAKTKKWYQFWR